MAVDQANLDKRYDVIKQRLESQARAGAQEKDDAIKRRFAAMGNLGSGAYVKTAQNAQNETQKNILEAGQNVDMQKEAELQRLTEVDEGRKYATSERVAGQGFQESMLGKQQAYGTSERIAGQGFQEGILGKQQSFAATQADIQRKYGTSEREAGQLYASGERRAAEKYNTSERLAAQGFSKEMTEKQRAWQDAIFTETNRINDAMFTENARLDEWVTQFNMGMARAEFNKQDLLEKIFSRFPGGSTPSAGPNSMAF